MTVYLDEIVYIHCHQQRKLIHVSQFFYNTFLIVVLKQSLCLVLGRGRRGFSPFSSQLFISFFLFPNKFSLFPLLLLFLLFLVLFFPVYFQTRYFVSIFVTIRLDNCTFPIFSKLRLSFLPYLTTD